MNRAEKIFEKLDSLDFSIVKYKLTKAGYKKKTIPRMIKEYFRYISICASSKKRMAPSFLVDEVWHPSILNTKQYFQISKIAGRYLHHVPNDGSKAARKIDQEAFWNTVQEYHDNFGEPDLEVWGLKRRVK